MNDVSPSSRRRTTQTGRRRRSRSCLDNPGTGGEAEVRWPAGRRGQSHHKIPEVAAMDSRRQHRRRQGPLTLADAYYVTPGPPDAGRV